MAKYKCLNPNYKTFIEGEVYNDSDTGYMSTLTIKDYRYWYPNHWQLVVEEFVLPRAWHVVVTKDNKKILSNWRVPKDPSFKLEPGCITGIHENGNKEWDYSSTDNSDYGKEITFDQFKKYVLKEDNMKQEIIGYEFKKGLYTQYNAALNMLLRRSGNSTLYRHKYLIYGWKDAINIFKEAGVLDLWFDPVYKEQYTLPEINGYNGRVDGYNIKYGCANFDIYKLRDLYKCKSLSGCRDIKSITLSSDVTITMKEIKQKIDYYDNMW